MNDDTLSTVTLTSSSQSTGVMLSPIKQDLMKGSRVCVSFQGNWWDTLSREQQLLYIQQHPSTTKKVTQAATKVGKAAVHLSGKALKAAGKAAASAGRSMIAASIAAKPKLKAAFGVLGSKGAGALSAAGKAVIRKDGVRLGILMALVFAAGLAAGPVVWFAPLLATAYINWKLENSKDSDAPDIENSKDSDAPDIQNVTPNSQRRTRDGPRQDVNQAAAQPNSTAQPTASAPAQPTASAPAQPTAATNPTPAITAPVAAVAPVAPAPTNASTPAPAAEPATPVFKKAEKKERTAEEEADAMVDEFKSWLESGKAEELAAKIQSDKVLAKAAAKSKAIVEKMQKPNNKKKKKKQQQSKEAA